MAITVTKFKVNGVETTVSTGAATVALPYVSKGEAVVISDVTASGSAASTPVYTGSVPSGTVVAAGSVTVTVSDNAEPAVTATVTLTITLGEGVGAVSSLTYPGWFKFKRMPMNLKYTTNGVTLKGVEEVLAVQAAKIVSFEFDPATRKLVLYTATNTQASNNTNYEVVILALGD
jgi:hypothetical protein